MSEITSSAEQELEDIQAGIPDDSIISEVATPATIAPVVTIAPIVGYGTPVESKISVKQQAELSSKEQQSSRQKHLSSSVKISEASKVITTEDGGDTEQATFENETISFQISIPISIQT